MLRGQAREIIERYRLKQHPEGGWFCETYLSPDSITAPERFGAGARRPSATGIYYLLEAGDFSSFHRIKSDETWLYHSGGPLSLHVINANGTLTTRTLGNPFDFDSQITIPAGLWFAAEVGGADSYALVSCYVSPGFTYQDWELANRDDLVARYSQHETLIRRLTRVSASAPSPCL